jgi:hypothetical protein
MRNPYDTLLYWLDAIEEDVGDANSMNVFVAAIGAVGVTMSGATVLGDMTRKVFPHAGAVQHVNLVHRRAFDLAAPVILAVGTTLPERAIALRRARSRRLYLIVGIVALAFSLYQGIGGWFNWHRDSGYRVPFIGHVTHNIPMALLTLTLAITGFVIAVVCAVAMVRRDRSPRWVMYFVERTPLGLYTP